MKRKVITYNAIEGFHRYPDAPAFCGYLVNLHRHIFVIECRFKVSHNEREIEINDQQQKIGQAIEDKFGRPANFGGVSCESIAEWLLVRFPNMDSCKVLEDGYGGAELSR